jgi:hypothetical protein
LANSLQFLASPRGFEPLLSRVGGMSRAIKTEKPSQVAGLLIDFLASPRGRKRDVGVQTTSSPYIFVKSLMHLRPPIFPRDK